jgi:hypothetical protein
MKESVARGREIEVGRRIKREQERNRESRRTSENKRKGFKRIWFNNFDFNIDHGVVQTFFIQTRIQLLKH